MAGGFEFGGPGRKREIPVEMAGECQAVEAEIRETFRGVTRVGGVSWEETYVIDSYGSDEDREAARLSDRDHSWEELIDDSGWETHIYLGGFNYLDSIGYRYYLPAAMIRCLRRWPEERTAFALTIQDKDPRFGEYRQWQIALLNLEQSACIARFLRLMVLLNRRDGQERADCEWRKALESHWSKFG